MEGEVTGGVSRGTKSSNRETSLGKNDRPAGDLSTSPTDPLRRPQRRTSSASSADQSVRTNGAAEHADRIDGHRPSSSNGDENHLSINPTYKIPILGYEVMEERAKFTVFKLRVENEQQNENWLVFRRYTDFERLYAKLKEEYPLLAISLPPKRWLRDNFETAFLEERLKGLQAFVDSILLRHKLAQSPTVREFFCFDDPPLSYADDNVEVHLSLEENKLASALQAKQNEIDVLRTELLLMKTQYDNLLRLTKNCGHCNIQQRKSLTTSPPAERRLVETNHSASSSVNASPKKQLANDSKTSAKIRNCYNASSSSSSTSTSYAEIPTKRSSNVKDEAKSNRRSSTGNVEIKPLPEAVDSNQPHAPRRKQRKSTPSSTAFIKSTNEGTNQTSVSKPDSTKLSTPISPLHDDTTIDLTPENDCATATGDVIL